jgi:ribosome biogenesis GTPase
MSKLEIAQYFPSFEKDALECFYSNCLHISEKNCKIKDRLESGDIPEIAYKCYLELLEEAERR